MKWTLDDNGRSAFHYLLGGVAVVLLVRLAAFGLDALTTHGLADSEAEVLLPFQHGYLLGSHTAVVGTSADRMERLAFAVVTSVIGALTLGAIAALLARIAKKRAGRAGIAVARIVLVLLLGWSLYAAFFLPVRTVLVEEGGLVLRDRTALFGDIPLPFTGREEQVPHALIDRLEAARTPCEGGCRGREELVLVRRDGERDVLAVQEGICPADELDRLRSASEAAALLEREMH